MPLSGTCGDRNVGFAAKGLKNKSVCHAKPTLRLVQGLKRGWKRESSVWCLSLLLAEATTGPLLPDLEG